MRRRSGSCRRTPATAGRPGPRRRRGRRGRSGRCRCRRAGSRRRPRARRPTARWCWRGCWKRSPPNRNSSRSSWLHAIAAPVRAVGIVPTGRQRDPGVLDRVVGAHVVDRALPEVRQHPAAAPVPGGVDQRPSRGRARGRQLVPAPGGRRERPELPGGRVGVLAEDQHPVPIRVPDRHRRRQPDRCRRRRQHLLPQAGQAIVPPQVVVVAVAEHEQLLALLIPRRRVTCPFTWQHALWLGLLPGLRRGRRVLDRGVTLRDRQDS